MLRARRNEEGNSVTKMLPNVTKSYPEIEIDIDKEINNIIIFYKLLI